MEPLTAPPLLSFADWRVRGADDSSHPNLISYFKYMADSEGLCSFLFGNLLFVYFYVAFLRFYQIMFTEVVNRIKISSWLF